MEMGMGMGMEMEMEMEMEMVIVPDSENSIFLNYYQTNSFWSIRLKPLIHEIANGFVKAMMCHGPRNLTSVSQSTVTHCVFESTTHQSPH